MNLEINISEKQIEAALEKAIKQKVNEHFKRFKSDIEQEWEKATYLCVKEMLESEEGKAAIKKMEQDAFAKQVAKHLSRKFVSIITSGYDDYDY